MMKKENTKTNIKMVLVIVAVILAFIGIIFAIKTNLGGDGRNERGILDVLTHKNINFEIVDNEESLVKTRFLNKAEDDFRKSELKNRATLGEINTLKMQLLAITDELKKQKLEQAKATNINNQQTVSTENIPSPPSKDFSAIFKEFPNGLPNSTTVESAKAKIRRVVPVLKEEEEEVTYEYEEIEDSMTISEASKSKDKKENIVSSEKNTIPKDAFFIPAGSVTVAYLEQGYDAPTLKTGSNDLVPSTLTIVGYTLLPNNKMYDLRGCKILAEAEGKRSNERSYSRTKRLSCIDNQDAVMDIPMRGYVSDEGGDGKLGLKGNIVSMQNKFLQNAIWIGIVEGLASIGKATAMTQTATYGGAVTTVDKGKEFQSGMAMGLTDTTSTIKEFLMENVRSIEPVVEIKGGRLVAITLSEGIYIYPRIDYKGRG
jgi:hypothetical protein